VETTTQETRKMTRGRKAKVTKAPTRQERSDALRTRILNLKDELMNEGFGAAMPPPGPIVLAEEEDKDPLIGGFIGKVKETLGTYVQRVSIADNFSQRPPFDHVTDPIYRRLIRDFIAGAAMPESKLAALSTSSNDRKSASLTNPTDIQFSVIDGLQRLYCFCIALLLVFRRDRLVTDGIIPKEAWTYFSERMDLDEDARHATEKLLTRTIRYEIFYNIDLAGLLHYMVTFNTGQRRMSLGVQLEIMRRPLIEELRRDAKIPIFEDIQRSPGVTKPKDQFAASDLVLATQAFFSGDAQVTAGDEAERLLEDQKFLDNVGDITDVVRTFKFIATEVQPEIARVYAADPNKRYIISNSSLFLMGFSAACGYYRERNNMKMLDGALEKLLALLKRPIDDPLQLEEYAQAQLKITSSRGKAIRRMVDDTFRRFFMGATTELEWAESARE
jgi:hypothetical protein